MNKILLVIIVVVSSFTYSIKFSSTAHALEYTPLSRPADEFSWSAIGRMVIPFSSLEVNSFSVSIQRPGYL